MAERVSPHTRGWTHQGHQGGRDHAGFPAHAGMDLEKVRDTESGTGFPRTRGDGPLPQAEMAADRQVSPHTRGWTR